MNTDGTLTYNVDSTGMPPWGYSLTTTRSVATSTWNFYTLVLNVPSSTGTLSGTLYINGVAENLSTSITTGGNGSVDANFADIDIGAHRNGGYGTSYFTGSIDDVRIYSRALSATEVASLYNNSGVGTVNKSRLTTNSSLDTGLVGYWTFDGSDISGTTAYDRSGSGNNGTLTNGPTRAIEKVGQALNFDGANDYVISSSNLSSRFSDDSVTISAWIYPTAGGVVVSELGQTSINSLWHDSQIEVLPTGEIKVSVWQLASLSLGTAPLNTWHHVVMRYTDSTDTLDGFLDGVKSSSTVSGNRQTPWQEGSAGLYYAFGAADSTNLGDGTYFNGKMDDIRIYNRSLSDAEVVKIYNLNATKFNATQQVTGTSLDSGLVGYWSFNGPDISGTTAYDRSGQGNNGTLTNGPTQAIGKVGQALSFDGVDDYVVVGSLSNPPSINAITMSSWIYWKSSTESYNTILENYGGSSGYGILLRSDQKIASYFNDSGGYIDGGGSSVPFNTWTHIVSTYDGANVKIYINGVLDQTLGWVGSFSNNTNLRIGHDQFGAGRYFNGAIDDVRIYNRALSASEVKLLYNLGR